MNQEGSINQNFGQATGRLNVCAACRKPLPRPEINQLVLVCCYCNSETILTRSLQTAEDTSLRIDSQITPPPTPAMIIATNLQPESNRREVSVGSDDDFELRLEPESDRVVPTSSLTGWQAAQASATSLNADQDRLATTKPYNSTSSTNVDPAIRSEQAKQSYNDSAGIYPQERHYPTLEAMQRLYKLFGYVAVLIVFPYVGVRFLYLLVTTKEQYLQVLAEFSEFAVPALFGCVALTASLFAASEGIRLAMDVQDNTLRTANSTGRRKVK